MTSTRRTRTWWGFKIGKGNQKWRRRRLSRNSVIGQLRKWWSMFWQVGSHWWRNRGTELTKWNPVSQLDTGFSLLELCCVLKGKWVSDIPRRKLKHWKVKMPETQTQEKNQHLQLYIWTQDILVSVIRIRMWCRWMRVLSLEVFQLIWSGMDWKRWNSLFYYRGFSYGDCCICCQ